jgi:UDP-N-acetylglucosamine diphosphorylase/glucosamine-1-phosphate N-acetyltransferase
MKNIILFEDDARTSFLPLSYTRPIAAFRVGILTIAEKWEKWLKGKVSYITQDYLAKKYAISISEDNYVINSSILPNDKIVSLIKDLSMNEAFLLGDHLLAVRLDDKQFEKLLNEEPIDELKGVDLAGEDYINPLTHLWEIFQKNPSEIQLDFSLLTKGKKSQPLDNSNTLIGDKAQLFIEEGAEVRASILNTENGPIYIGKEAKVMEGCMIRGPFAMLDGAVVKMGAKIYEGSTLGPHCKVGGEVNNSVFFGYANKAHDGFLGNAVIGQWCNIGADTNNSNLKNNYAEVKLWDYKSQRFELTGTQFCGLIMGDHSKVGINVMFNTGTVVGVSANIFGAGFPRNFIPSFSWGGASHYKTFQLAKAYEVAEAVMKRREKEFTNEEKEILAHVFEVSAPYRRWEK